MRRVFLGAGLILGALGALSPATSSAATIVGQAAPASAIQMSCAALTGVQDASGAGAPSYTIPTDGVLTSFRTRASAATGKSMRLIVFRGVGPTFTVVGRGDSQPLTPSTLNQFPARMPVQAGDLLGVDTTGGWCVFAGVAGDHHWFDFFDPAPGGPFNPGNDASGNRWNVEATLEPDADHDGYGDETQDQCPTDASTQGPCPAAPATGQRAAALKKCKKKHSARARRKCRQKANLLPL